ncbi:MAG: alpha/beta fold hydrolase [Bryobacteraceae bacterium]|nr:alpha/beta fold hydrolase [Bryobacteraceae bacterium]
MSSVQAWAFGPFVLDVAGRRLLRDGSEIPLTPKMFETLCLLIHNQGRVLSRQQILDAVWPDSIVEENNLSQNISQLRKALSCENYIVTVPKYGYRFSANVIPAPVSLVPEKTNVPETKYTRSGDINIAWQTLGEGPIDIVFVMGWISHVEYFWKEPSFAAFLRRLASFSRLILFDKRGTGLSDRVPAAHMPTLEQRMEDVRMVLRAAGSTRAVIVGVSEGGPMSALFAATYPEVARGLVMIGSYARRLRAPDYPWGVSEEEREEFLTEIETDWGGPVGLEERAPSKINDPQFREWWATYLRMSASPGAALSMTRMNAQIDVRHILPTIRVPTLVIHRTSDPCLRVEEGRYLASRIPGAKFVELPGVDHLPFVGDQTAILDEIQAFVSGLGNDTEFQRVLATVLYIRNHRLTRDWVDAEQEIRSDIDWYGGHSVLVDPRGAAAAFDGPARAIRCAAALLHKASQRRLRISIGIHTGECEKLRSGQVSGVAVDITARLAHLAPEGESLVSSTVRDLLAGSSFNFEARGQFTFRQELGEWRLFQVGPEQALAAPNY